VTKKRSKSQVIRGKRSRLPPPQDGDVLNMAEPTKAELRGLRRQLIAHKDKPLPLKLDAHLRTALFWAAWQIGRPWTRARRRYQRYRAVREGMQGHGLKLELACDYAAKKLVDEPARGRPVTMKRDYMIEHRRRGRRWPG
jgi:hypothetical protein